MTDTPSPQSVVVPREPTREMLNAAIDVDSLKLGDISPLGFRISPQMLFEKCWSAMLAAAPAPSSLAGGEVMNDDAPTYMRLAQALSRHPEVMVVERSDPTLELTPDSLEHLLEDVFPLAALSPEAPAQEGEELDDDDASTYEPSIAGLSDYLWNQAMGAESVESRCILEMWREAVDALTPRHEAPADKDPVPSEWTGQGADDDFFTPAKTAFSKEAPAEGAGEDEWSALEKLADAATAGPWSYDETNSPFYNDPEGRSCGGEATGFAEVFQEDDIDTSVIDGARLKDAAFIAAANPATVKRLIATLRARSSAPEAREHPCYGEHQPGCDCVIPTQTETEAPPFLKRMTDAEHEAPAEGAGERDAPLTFTPFRDELREAQAALEPFAFIAERRGLSPATTVHLVHLDGTHIETLEVNSFWRARHAHSALCARSSAPEAREEALGNLLAVIHGDGGHRALEVGTKQAALEAEQIVAGLFAAPSADKLRELVEAAFIAGATSVHEHWTANPGEAPNGDPEFDEAANDYALAALKAEPTA